MTKEKKDINARIEIPEGVTAEINGTLVKIKGKLGETVKKMFNPKVSISKQGNNIILKALKPTKREIKLANTFTAHIKNMIKGVNGAYEYKMKICSGHFPMNVSVKDGEFIIKNFFGEKIPRIIKIKKGVNVKVEGDMIVIDSLDKELAGQVAADIEQLTRRTKFDTRIFQDGCYIISKGSEEIK